MPSQRVVPFVLLALCPFCAYAQAVVSTHSGVIHYSEGSVFIDDQRVEQRAGRYTEIKQGSVLRTEDGRAEILLTPGTFLRVGETSAIRLISNRLTDTRVEFLSGSAVLESVTTAPGAAVVMIYKASEVRFHTPGLYRFNSGPPEFRVEEGQAEVLSDGRPVTVKRGQALPFSAGATPQAAANADDALDSWCRRRSISVAASDASAAQTEDMAVFLDSSPPVDAFGAVPSYGVFPYIPLLGGYPVGGYAGYMGYGPWSSPFYMPGAYYLPAYSGYAGYRSGYRPLSPFRTGTAMPFRPPVRVVSPPMSRPAISAPRGAGAVHAGHR
jgi:hypothetical protein